MSEPSKISTVNLADLLKCGASLDDLPTIEAPRLSDVLNECIGQIGKPITTIAELSGVNNSTFHSYLNGEKHPSRNVLLRLAFVMEISFEMTQILLKSGNRSLLSGSRKRDVIIMQGIIQQHDLATVCDALKDSGFNDLFSRQDF